VEINLSLAQFSNSPFDNLNSLTPKDFEHMNKNVDENANNSHENQKISIRAIKKARTHSAMNLTGTNLMLHALSNDKCYTEFNNKIISTVSMCK